uniref:ABC transporter G family member 31 n=1 Tax=Tanacetum cinerariifolium TaxID=118510 RepID=A0A6L2JEY6_TANCI|nr:ABC transporter G family member 31 [Tanacetum cinerariifolium]
MFRFSGFEFDERINGRNEDRMLDEMLKWKSTFLVEEEQRTINARGSQNYEGMVDPSYEKLKQTPGENKKTGKITYNGHELHEFCVQRTSAYISQTENNSAKLTVRETLDFDARYEGEGFAENLTELSRLEKENKIRPRPEIDVSMKESSVVH